MQRRRALIVLSTARGAIAASGTATRTKEIPYPFKIAYLRVEHAVGQAGYLRTSVHIGPLGTSGDEYAYEWDRSGVAYFIGDGSVREFMNLTKEYPANHKITAYFNNQHATDAFTGICEAVVEEL